MLEVRWWLLPHLWRLRWRFKGEEGLKKDHDAQKLPLWQRIWRSCRNQENESRLTVKMGIKGKASNVITTSNYTLINFVPKFLFNQFKQFANFLFLTLCAIQCIPNLSPFGLQATLGPLVFILTCSLIREVYEEIRRRIRDRRVNYQLVTALTENGWEKVRWCNLHVGQAVRVEEGEQFPADLLFISSSEVGGVGYIETANLDGESSLKVRRALGFTSVLTTEEAVEEFWKSKGQIVSDLPNKEIHKFNGYLETADGEKTPLSVANLLLRGARLKNTDFIYGIIVYAGKDTKLKKNNTDRAIKSSRMAHMMNAVMLFQFGICMLLAASISYVYLTRRHVSFEKFVFFESENKSFFYVFLGFLLLFNGLVPISLYVTLEMIQVVQGLFIRADEEMFDEEREIGTDVKMFSLNSELGEVQYVMTDKTGTLTQNNMRFRQCSVGGVKYANKKSHNAESFKPRRMLQHMETEEMGNGDLIREFLTACAVCHTVNTDKHTSENDRPLYHATSPDEAALVNFAADADFVFHARVLPQNTIQLRVANNLEEYSLLHLCEFNSDRKRMSVIVRKADGTIKMYVKGADHVIMARLSSTVTAKEKKKAKNHLHSFATSGFRTLCFAARTVSEEEWNTWKPRLDEAALDINSQSLLADLAEQMEKDLELLGVSAIEDKLQEAVPETIERMLSSGMRVWVLTGDKLETAVNIGNSCRLLTPTTPMCVLAFDTLEETQAELEKLLKSLETNLEDRLRLALIVDSNSLEFLLNDPFLNLKFLKLAMCATAVICCRCTPLQKAAVTRLVKRNADEAVLAVGDGANDVAMIQEADVGIGIAGLEGMQAALAADYSIAQFRYLDRLLFIHGTLSVFRTAKCILYSIYKNVIETTCLFIFTLISSTDQPMAEEWTIMRYNIFFTSWPALIIGTLDRPAGVDFFTKYSQMYTLYHNSLNIWSQLSWFGVGIVHGLTVIFTMYMFWGEGVLGTNGRDDHIYLFGIIIYLILVTIANSKAILETHSITIVSVVIAMLSFLALVVCHIWDAQEWQMVPKSVDIGDLLWHTPWPGTLFVWLLACAGAYLPDITLKVIRHSVYKDVRDLILWKEGVRGPNLDAFYHPIIKICDTVGLKQKGHHNKPTGFAFAQDDGQVVSQMQLISRRFDPPRNESQCRKSQSVDDDGTVSMSISHSATKASGS